MIAPSPASQVSATSSGNNQSGLRTCSIAGVGSYLPPRTVTNAELAASLGVPEERLWEQTGIRERRIADKEECTSVMATWAAARAMSMAGVSAADLDAIIVATVSPDFRFPSTACFVQGNLGARRAAAFDLNAGGAGFLYGLEIGQRFIASHFWNNVLLIGAEKLSAMVDWQMPNTCIHFGDGAGAVVLQHQPGKRGVLTTSLGADGRCADLFHVPGGGSRFPASMDSVSHRLHYVRMDVPALSRNAVTVMATAAKEALARCQLDITQIKRVIPQQASKKIIDALASQLGTAPEQILTTLEQHGYVSSAVFPINLHSAAESGTLQRGDLVLLVGFGSGMTWAASVVEF